jgi:biopolymer transport protein ExbD
MRFARHARIFRGPLDPAPMASVLLLLLIFLQLGSLLYTPGVLVQLGHGLPITVTSNNDILFDGKTYPAGDSNQLRSDLRAWSGDLCVKLEPGADPKVAQALSNLFDITLPDGKNLAATDDATVVVAVNFRGQCFFENQPVQDAQLKAKLAARLKISRKLTLILWMDKAAEIQVQAHLFALAREVGISDVRLAERPPLFDGRP